MSKTKDTLVLFAFIGIVIIAGTNFVAVKYSNQELAPFWGAAFRFFVASFIFFFLMIWQRISFPRGNALVGALLYGLLSFGASYAFLYWALLTVPAGLASVMIALVPLMTFFLALIHKLEKFRWRVLFGACVALAGIFIIFFEQMGTSITLLPFFALLAASVCIAEAGIVVKLYPKSNIFSMNAVGMLVGATLLVLLSIFAGEQKTLPTSRETTGAFAYLVAVGSVLFFALVVYVLKHWTASTVSYQLVLSPVIAIVFANMLLGETISGVMLLGSAVVLLGVYVGVLSEGRK